MSFGDIFGGVPEGTWVAPGRVNLIGEHTDYNDGFVLPFAIPQRTEVAAARGEDGVWEAWSALTGETIRFTVDDLTPGAVEGWGAYVASVVWALRERGYEAPGARLAITSDVPLGAGLSSSASLESAVLGALIDLGGLDVPVEERPAIAQLGENRYVGMPSGILDQSASIRCREGHALFLDCRSLEVEHIPFDLAAAGLAILVINSNAPHQLVDGEYAARRASCEAAASALGVPALRDVPLDGLDDALARLDDEVLRRRTRHIVTEDDRVLRTVELLRAGDVRGIGPLMTASHASMRDDFEITVEQVDVAVAAALEAGAYGARMTGGGFGGCVLALVETSAADEVRGAVEKAYAARSFTPPTTFTATAAPGAHRL
ncbi:galactokinase [Catenuloplanes atrovinosus]|uniref:Galactokinase n=1 Tax=Catenuloplanes atrovinosus TaxID=137266 RepID=A0AAE4CDJ5_9ACTN|nr:galactokinase [Catenuloplanes atrovinosus]MDR7280676.1 galactokinase [Catenuloplanes atrovinosus]